MLPIMLVLCSNMNNINVRILLIECSIRAFTIRAYVLYFIYEYKYILNALLECIELFNTVYELIVLLESIDLDFSSLCWHNVPTYYDLNYAGIFDGGLVYSQLCTALRQHHSHSFSINHVIYYKI